MPTTDDEPYYCGFCVRAVVEGRPGFQFVCPACDWIWTERLTEPEARAFRLGFDTAADVEGATDDDLWAAAWLAVRRERERAAGVGQLLITSPIGRHRPPPAKGEP